MTLIEIAQLLENSEFGTALRESQYMFPIVEGVHLLGLALSFGLIFFIDLRLLGIFLPEVPISLILQQFRACILGGFVATFISGGLLFWAEAAKMLVNSGFQLKLLFMFFALINALSFELKCVRRGSAWLDQVLAPLDIRFAACASLILWGGVTIFGRLTPYMSG
jgi:hypothetical protein